MLLCLSELHYLKGGVFLRFFCVKAFVINWLLTAAIVLKKFTGKQPFEYK